MMNDQREPTGALKAVVGCSRRGRWLCLCPPEYNHGMSGALKDAIDYIGHQIEKAIYGR